MPEKTIERLATIAQAELFRSGGVDSWDWYDDSLESYTPSEDAYEDAVRFIDALDAGGVDNWEGASAALEGLHEYEDYLEGLGTLNDALDIHAWRAQHRDSAPTQEDAADAPPVIMAQSMAPAAQRLHQYLAGRYSNEDTDELYAAVVEAGVWKRSTFPKEFTAALKTVKGAFNLLYRVRSEYLERLIASGKLDAFIEDILKK